MKFVVTGCSGETLAKRMLKLAWDASGVVGYGAFQDRGQQDEQAVWDATNSRNDYGGQGPTKAAGGSVYADYVFGRMMKLNYKYGEDFVEGHMPSEWRRDYQSFCGKYSHLSALVTAAAQSLNVSVNTDETATV